MEWDEDEDYGFEEDDWEEDRNDDEIYDEVEAERQGYTPVRAYRPGARVASADFGLVEVEDAEHGQWLRQRERESVTRVCTRCEQPRTMHRDYAICGSCADAMERGQDF